MVLMKIMRGSFSGLKIVSKGEKKYTNCFSDFERIKVNPFWSKKYEMLNFVKQGWNRYSKNRNQV